MPRLDHFRLGRHRVGGLVPPPPPHPQYALEFDGEDDEVIVGHDASLNTPDGFTFACWVYHTSIPDIRQIYMTKGHINNDRLGIFHTRSGSNDGLMVRAIIGGEQYQISRGENESTGEWIFVVGLYNGSSLELYRNGSLVAEDANPSGSVTTNAEDLFIGRCSLFDGYPLEGSIGSCYMYDRGLSSTEVTSLYEGNVPESGLVGYWPMDEGSGSTVYDESENNNDGTIHGATWVELDDHPSNL